MTRPTFVQLDLEALKHNYRAIVEYVGRPDPADPSKPRPGVIAVVKANAYGHGSARVGLALEEAGADVLACADIEEGVLLREAGVQISILVFGALSVSDLDGVFAHNLTPTISSPFAGRALEAAAAARGCRLHCHLKVDTGMNRLGFRHDNLCRTLPEVLASRHLAIDALYTHFATADELDNPLFDEQLDRFERAQVAVASLGLRPRLRHAANSAALLRDKRTWYDRVRPGLLLYGVVPPPLVSPVSLRPVMSVHSRVVAAKGMRAGEGLGYGTRFVAERPTTIAVVPAGYADGLDVRLAGQSSVLVRGRRVPIVGAISMEMMTIDVTGLDVEPGDEVVIVGEQRGARIDVCEMAAAIGTVPHEILCRAGSRVQRIYQSHSVHSPRSPQPPL